MYFSKQHDFALLKQDSLSTEKFSKNEMQRNVSVVAKGLAFTIDVGSTTMNLHNAKISAKLFYDSELDEDLKPVELPKNDPMTYKVFISTSGDRASVECRIYVLTSQHENALFRIKIAAICGNQSLEVCSGPIRVVSKPSQIRKEKRKLAGTVTVASAAEDISASPPEICHAGTKRPAVEECLLRMEEEQRKQRGLIELLLSTRSGSSLQMEQSEDELEKTFCAFMSAFSCVAAEHRSSKVRKLISSLQPCQTEAFTEFLALSHEELTPSSISLPLEFPVSQKEQEAWDTVYSQLTWSPDSELSAN